MSQTKMFQTKIASAKFYNSSEFHDSCNNHGAQYNESGALCRVPFFTKKYKDCIYCQIDGGDDHVFYFFEWLNDKYSNTFDESIGTYKDLILRYKEFSKELKSISNK